MVIYGLKKGMEGGGDGELGLNLLKRKNGKVQNFGAKNCAVLEKGDRIVIMTPGGGGYGIPKSDNPSNI